METEDYPKNQVPNPIKFQQSSSHGGIQSSPRRKKKRGDDGNFKTGFTEEPLEVIPIKYITTPTTQERKTVEMMAEAMNIISRLFVNSAEEGGLNETEGGNKNVKIP